MTTAIEVGPQLTKLNEILEKGFKVKHISPSQTTPITRWIFLLDNELKEDEVQLTL